MRSTKKRAPIEPPLAARTADARRAPFSCLGALLARLPPRPLAAPGVSFALGEAISDACAACVAPFVAPSVGAFAAPSVAAARNASIAEISISSMPRFVPSSEQTGRQSPLGSGAFAPRYRESEREAAPRSSPLLGGDRGDRVDTSLISKVRSSSGDEDASRSPSRRHAAEPRGMAISLSHRQSADAGRAARLERGGSQRPQKSHCTWSSESR